MIQASTTPSKLPQVGTTIFTEMSALALEHSAINLSQGFPDFPLDAQLIDLVKYYMTEGHNQYAPMPGVPALRKQIASKLKPYHADPFDADQEITITSGATEGLFATINALVHPLDEVIILDPSYDLYAPAVVLAGGNPIHVELELPDFSINWDKLEKAMSPRTRVVIINNPNNPAGSILPRAELERLAELVVSKDLMVISDEVYEHMVYDGLQHHSILSVPDLRDRGVAVFSFGKTFHATGWKIGYTVAPPNITKELRKVHQFVTFSVNTPIQLAIADYLSDPDHYQGLSVFFQEKRDMFLNLMATSRFKPLPSRGTYFQLMSYADISDRPDREMAHWMTVEHGVASIPISVFYQNGRDHKLLRFCFGKNTSTLQEAAKKLCKI